MPYFDGGKVKGAVMWSNAEPLTLAVSANEAKVSAMAKRIPGLNAIVECPACRSGALTVRDLVIHLNDSHTWPRELIANHLEILEGHGLDLTVHNEPVEQPPIRYATLGPTAPPSWFATKLAQLKAEYVAEGEEKPVASLILSDDQTKVHIQTTTSLGGTVEFSMDLDMVSEDLKHMLYGTHKEEQ